MDKVFLEKYHQELKYFRDASKEFAEEHPRAATRLGLSAPEIEDPYVERLIEAVSFLTARVNLKIDAEYPKFVQHILKVIHPDLTQSIPSAAVVELKSFSKTSFTVPKLSGVSTLDGAKGNATCQFSTCSAVQVVPFTLEKIKYSHNIAEVLQTAGSQKKSKSLLNFEIVLPAGFSLDQLDVSNLRWFISSHDLKVSSELLYFLACKCEGMQVELAEGIQNKKWHYKFNPQFNFVGFNDSLAFYNTRSSNYLKHILEYAVLPEKYLFFKIDNLQDVFMQLVKQNVVTFNEADKDRILLQPLHLNFSCIFNDTSDVLDRYIDKDSLSFNSVVIHNVFKKNARIIVDQFANEQHIVIDKLRPVDFEVIKIDRIEGFSKLNHQVKVFEPIYKLTNDTDHFDQSGYGFFSEFHKQSNISSKKHSYKGSECFVLLSNQLKSMIEDDLDQLAVTAWCSNRALPSEISWSLDRDLKMSDDAYKVYQIKRRSSFTQPIAAPMENSSLWRLLNLLSSNFISLDHSNPNALTQQIKNNLYLFFEITANVAFKSQVNAIQNIRAEKIRRVKRIEHQLTPISGIHFNVIIDDMLMSHVHPYLWGRVLLEYFKGFSPINQFVEISLKNQNNTLIAQYSSI